MSWPRTPDLILAAGLAIGVAGAATATERAPAPAPAGLTFDPCTVRPGDYRSTVALAIDGRWREMPVEVDDGEPDPASDREGRTRIVEVGPWGLRIRTEGEGEPIPLFFERGEVWDFDPPPWMPRPDPASRVSENHRLEIALPCAQHRLPRLYGAGRAGDDETVELFLTVVAPDRLAGREVRRSASGTALRKILLAREPG